MPGYQGEVGAHGKRLVNSHNTRQGEDVARGDAHTGTLTSKPFQIERPYVNFLIGGGDHKGKTCLNLLVDGKPVLSATGRRENRLAPASFDVRAWQGRTARLQILDDVVGEWGNVGVDHIVFSDRPVTSTLPLRERPDFGTMTLALLGAGEGVRATAALPDDRVPPGVFTAKAGEDEARPFGKTLIGSVSRTLALDPGEAATVTFVVAWHFPNLRFDGLTTDGRWYATKFPSAVAVARYVADHFDRLSGQTRTWRDTWYDSTLPHWFLDRTFPECVDPGDLHLLPVRQRPILRLGGGRVLRRHLHPRLALCAGRRPPVPRAGARHPRAGRPGPRLRPEDRDRRPPRRVPRRRGRRRPGGDRPPRLPRAPDGGRRRLPPPELAADQGGAPAADRPGRRRRRHPGRAAAQHARRRVVRPDPLALRPLPCRPPRRRGDGPRAGGRRVRRSLPGDLRGRPRQARRADLEGGVRLLRPGPRPGAPGRRRLVRGLRDRPGARPGLGGSVGARAG